MEISAQNEALVADSDVVINKRNLLKFYWKRIFLLADYGTENYIKINPLGLSRLQVMKIMII